MSERMDNIVNELTNYIENQMQTEVEMALGVKHRKDVGVPMDSVKIKQSKEIERLPDDLPARFELPDGKAMIMKTYTDSKDFVEASYSRELINKINELVDAVNELREAKNDKSIS